MREILITAADVTVRARLLDTPTADRIWQALPIMSAARVWGGEVYFDAPISTQTEPNARETICAGEIVFWPQGDAIAIGFGPTPLSRKKSEIRLAAPCNVWAHAIDDVRQFKKVHAGEEITILQSK